jgi:hypothetical protein
MIPGTRVELIEEQVGQHPDCEIPTGTVVTQNAYRAAYGHNPPFGEIPVKWDQPDFVNEIDAWPRYRLKEIEDAQGHH